MACIEDRALTGATLLKMVLFRVDQIPAGVEAAGEHVKALAVKFDVLVAVVTI